MSVARTTEISAISPESFEAAINEGLQRTQKDQGIVLDEDGSVAGYRVRMVITFILE